MVRRTFHHLLILTVTPIDHLQMKGTDGTIFTIGDCTATVYAPTAQAANQQGAYLARYFHQMAIKDNLAADINRLETAYPHLTLSEEKQECEADFNLVKKQLV